MINIFNETYTLIVNTLTALDSTIKTSSVYTNTPSDFPFVSIEEINNSVYENTSDSCDIENHANIQFEINIYTQNPQKKSKGDGIANAIDNLLKSYNFVRITKTPLPNTSETIYHLVMRYEGIVSKDSVVYRR